jgi:putative ABC transport system permease protein
MLNFLLETFRLGLRNLYLHKLRSLLTAMGIIIGVAAVIAMVAVGEGTKQAALAQLRQLGAKNILIRSVPPAESTEATGRTSRVLTYGLHRDDFERLKTLPKLAKIIPMRDTEQKVTHGGLRAGSAHSIGTVPEAFDVINLPLARGHYFNQIHYYEETPVCVIGAAVAKQLFPFEDPLGAEVQIGTSGRSTAICTVIGVLEPTGVRGEGQKMIGRDLDEDVYFPLSVAQTAFGDAIFTIKAGSNERKIIELSEVWMQVKEVEDVEPIAAVAENTVAAFHSGSVDYVVKAPIEILRAAEAEERRFNFIMVATASLSLIVGGIGIMNIMLATVTERTREIGIRRALGAKRKHIILQFLIETTVISLAGGLIGIALGMGAARIVPWIAHFFSNQGYPTIITTWSVVCSLLISAIIGIGFGMYPARKAAMMDPIDALRHE